MTTQKEYDSKNRLKTITVRLDDATDLRCTFEYRNNFCHTRVYDDWKRDKGGIATLICQRDPQKGLVDAMNHIKSFEKTISAPNLANAFTTPKFLAFT